MYDMLYYMYIYIYIYIYMFEALFLKSVMTLANRLGALLAIIAAPALAMWLLYVLKASVFYVYSYDSYTSRHQRL